MQNFSRLPNSAKIGIALLFIALLAGGGWWLVSQRSANSGPTLTATPLNVTAVQSQTLLANLPPETTGVNFTNTLQPENQIKYAYNGAGVAAGDYDNDGLVDIFLVSEETPSKLFHNVGNMRFEDVTEAAGLGKTTDSGGFGIGAYFADIDNDGDLDLFVTNWNVTNRLFRNNGDSTFTDITEAAGVTYAGGATTAAFADYDRDGDLDFFVATYRPSSIENEESVHLQMQNGQLVIPPELQDRLEVIGMDEEMGHLRELGERDLLYRNNGDGTFAEVAAQAGIQGGYWGLSAVFSDIDNDNWPDLYVTNDLWSPDGFYHNNGDGTFAVVKADMVQNSPMFSMGIDFADINNDGNMDYFIGDMMSRDHTRMLTQHGSMEMMTMPESNEVPQLMQNGLYLNNGDGSFSNIAWLADIAASEWTWSVKFADMDLDGYVDLLITNGMVRDLMDSDAAMMTMEIEETQGKEAAMAYLQEYPKLDTPNLAFRNNGDLTFSDVSAQWGFDTAGVGNGSAMADFDNDGDLDVVVNFLNQPTAVYRNDATSPRVFISLIGDESNREGIGARLTLTTDNGIQTHIISSSGGYLSSHQPAASFGLGTAKSIQELRIEWPSGRLQTFGPADIQANHAYVIREGGEAQAITAPQTAVPSSWFADTASSAGLNQAHVESNFDDFAVQMLLPRKLSVLGPGVAWGDSDGDGDDDLYISGDAGQSGALYRNDGNGRFTNVTASTTAWRTPAEEMAPLWWYSGQNTTPDLLLAYSSVENKQPITGRFSPSGKADSFLDAGWTVSSNSSSGALASADFDGDGDLDVFVGGRVVPGQWPLPASSSLFANNNGQLTDVTATAAPELAGLGMVTGAVWSDLDNDGDSDLLLATEFGPIHVLTNDNGRLTDTTASWGLDRWTGLWTGIVTGDFNRDGRTDIAAANLGWNTKYHASIEQPLTVFGGDIDGDGGIEVIEAENMAGTLYPMIAPGMVEMDIPFIMDAFPMAKEYAEATLDQIYGDRLNSMTKLTATTLAHTVFLNDGQGHFTAAPLPQLAQSFPGYGLAVLDFDNDGLDDLYLAGNFSYADHETMMYTGGTSYLLKGNGDGTFNLIDSATSGLLVPHDARSVAVADYDQNGQADIVVGLNNHAPMLFRNTYPQGQNCALTVSLQGTAVNPTAVGAKITVTLPDGTSTSREIQAGSGYLSQNSPRLLFGMGAAATASVSVRWPDGTTTSQENVARCTTLSLPSRQ